VLLFSLLNFHCALKTLVDFSVWTFGNVHTTPLLFNYLENVRLKARSHYT
jgi:hypothetical protein